MLRRCRLSALWRILLPNNRTMTTLSQSFKILTNSLHPIILLFSIIVKLLPIQICSIVSAFLSFVCLSFIFSGDARRAGPASMLILCLSVCVSICVRSFLGLWLVERGHLNELTNVKNKWTCENVSLIVWHSDYISQHQWTPATALCKMKINEFRRWSQKCKWMMTSTMKTSPNMQTTSKLK